MGKINDNSLPERIPMRLQEEKTLAKYNELLKQCKDFKTSNEVMEVTGFDSCTVRYRCHELVKLGYMEMKRERYGRYQQVQVFFRSLKPEFNFNQYLDIIEQQRLNKSKAGKLSNINNEPRNIEPYVEPSLAQPVYKHTMERLSDKYREQAKLAHKEWKEKKNEVNGSTINSVFFV